MFPPHWLPLGGLLSGFFGGLSGNQGALRSAFLLKAGLSKEAFIATGTVSSGQRGRLTTFGVRQRVHGRSLGSVQGAGDAGPCGCGLRIHRVVCGHAAVAKGHAGRRADRSR